MSQKEWYTMTNTNQPVNLMMCAVSLSFVLGILIALYGTLCFFSWILSFSMFK